jgi:hypothetical protein
MIALSLLQESWPFARSILKLFERITSQNEREKGRELGNGMTQELCQNLDAVDARQSDTAPEADTANNSVMLPTVVEPFDFSPWTEEQNTFGYFDASFWDQLGCKLSSEVEF